MQLRRLIDLALVLLVASAALGRADADSKSPRPAKRDAKPNATPDPTGDARPGADAGAPVSDPKIEKADQLFAEGKALMASNLLQACDKFSQSLRENPAAIGTLLNVALCDEKLGRVASAVAKFAEARDRSKEQGLIEHQRAAEDHIAALEPAVPHLAISLTQPLPDTKILIDDRVIALGDLGNVAVDPGERVLVVSAPARLPYRTTLVVERASHQAVVIPALARSVTVRSSRRRIGQIVTIAGVAALGTGIGIGFYANSQFDQPFKDKLCTHDDDLGDRCNPDGRRKTDRARSLGSVGTVVGITGASIAVVGALLWIWSPSAEARESNRAVSVVPSIAGDQVGVVALGRF